MLSDDCTVKRVKQGLRGNLVARAKLVTEVEHLDHANITSPQGWFNLAGISQFANSMHSPAVVNCLQIVRSQTDCIAGDYDCALANIVLVEAGGPLAARGRRTIQGHQTGYYQQGCCDELMLAVGCGTVHGSMSSRRASSLGRLDDSRTRSAVPAGSLGTGAASAADRVARRSATALYPTTKASGWRSPDSKRDREREVMMGSGRPVRMCSAMRLPQTGPSMKPWPLKPQTW